jgi:hypothetical protein
LLVAKLHKIAERLGSKRAVDKDALDVLRLLRGVEETQLRAQLAALTRDPRSAVVATEAVGHLRTLFGRDDSAGCIMAGRAAFPAESADLIAKSASILAAAVVRAVDR